MNQIGTRIPVLVIGAVVTVLLQVILAPNIAVFSAVPNLIVVFVLVCSLSIRGIPLYVTAFVLGLIGDLLGYGPVGVLPLLLLVAAACASRAFVIFDNDTVFVPMAILALFILLVELLYAAFMLAMGFVDDPLQAFIFRALPCTVYECVLGLLLYRPLSRMLTPDTPTMPSATPRLRFH